MTSSFVGRVYQCKLCHHCIAIYCYTGNTTETHKTDYHVITTNIIQTQSNVLVTNLFEAHPTLLPILWTVPLYLLVLPSLVSLFSVCPSTVCQVSVYKLGSDLVNGFSAHSGTHWLWFLCLALISWTCHCVCKVLYWAEHIHDEMDECTKCTCIIATAKEPGLFKFNPRKNRYIPHITS